MKPIIIVMMMAAAIVITVLHFKNNTVSINAKKAQRPAKCKEEKKGYFFHAMMGKLSLF